MTDSSFQLPRFYDFGATAAFALSGVFAGVRRGYDIVGVFFLAGATALGGGLIRDGIFLHDGPPLAVRSPDYLVIVAGACAAGILFARRMHRFERWIMLGDALGLGGYAVVGTQMALASGLNIPAALLIGLLNACGGGILRDVLAGETPLIFQPGYFYLLAALAGETSFVGLTVLFGSTAKSAAAAAIALTFALRILTVRFKWRTRPAAVIDTR